MQLLVCVVQLKLRSRVRLSLSGERARKRRRMAELQFQPAPSPITDLAAAFAHNTLDSTPRRRLSMDSGEDTDASLTPEMKASPSSHHSRSPPPSFTRTTSLPASFVDQDFSLSRFPSLSHHTHHASHKISLFARSHRGFPISSKQ